MIHAPPRAKEENKSRVSGDRAGPPWHFRYAGGNSAEYR
jgi:hypothetical protein